MQSLWDALAQPMSTPDSSTADVADLLAKAATYDNDAYDLARAQRWAAGFEFPPHVYTTHWEEFQSSGLSFEAYVAHKQDALRPSMISPARFAAAVGPYRHLISTDDYSRGLAVAQGIQVPTAPGFRERSAPAPFRKKYTQGKSAIHKLTFRQYTDGTLIAFPTDRVDSIPRSAPFHYNDVNWAGKKESDSGRLITDCSYADGGSHLNGDNANDRLFLRVTLDATYGRVELDNLESLAHMVLSAVDQFGWDDTILFTKDVRKAFNQLFFLPQCVRLFAVAFIGGLTFFHIVGNFGWTGLPNAWAVISRVLLCIARARIATATPGYTPTLVIYVDDFCGATGSRMYPTVSHEVNSSITDTIGPGGLADEKDRMGRDDFAMLGWSFDLPTRTVALAERNLLKTISSALKVDTRRGMVSRLGPLQSLASRLSRAAALSPVMRTFTVSIYTDIAGYKGNKKSKRCLRGETRADIVLWRSFLVLMGTQRRRFCRHLDSFRPPSLPTVRVAFDGSLFGLGTVVWHRDSSSQGFSLLAFASIYPTPFHLSATDSSYQNSSELAAATAGTLIALSFGYRAFTFELVGDSVTVLRWSEKGRVSSNIARRMAVGFALASATTGAVLFDTTYVSSADNAVCDDLSRGVRDNHAAHLDQSRFVDIGPTHLIHQYLAECDPSLPCDTLHLNTSLCTRLGQLLSAIQHPPLPILSPVPNLIPSVANDTSFSR